MFDLQGTVDFIRSLYGDEEFIPLHAPRFVGNEKNYLNECVDSTFVSSVGAFVNRFEELVAEYTGARHAIAVVNGTQALYASLKLLGAQSGDLVITQSLTFVATANAIAYTGGRPAFVDVDADTLGMSPDSLRSFLETQCERASGEIRHRESGARVRAVAPMHTFGHACRIEDIKKICGEFELPLLEDAAESLGSWIADSDTAPDENRKRHTGTLGVLGTLSFNGNKIITTGGGGMILTDDDELGKRARHLTTTAKVPHAFEFIHDEVGYNFRMPNLNAALGVAQMESLERLLRGQRSLADRYREFFAQKDGVRFVDAPDGSDSNFWMNAIRFETESGRNQFLEAANEQGIGSRAVWRPMHMLDMFADAPRQALPETEAAYNTVVNIPSTVPADFLSGGGASARAAS
ncbi:MAG: LegC family aminotransferase [bacterium]|nr:LegC family aminotransferase [bacterium]